ncbi:Ig-like domain-containing protein [Myxococcus llanfairpwllgwyngyllgogerychwyrndrobwllllantysiliogogogochensis]|uniref:Ig-like domain-containing protein n=1 Tax=Myxococcus llanfairpwllgwyngyllgogerychwyrndrobwllllantysiliogogogochensis TaxID=2590453 RepID=UPI0015F0712B|nr:Ig-like domain-containing protein [Myxococcus llanfairpwllgwyngyllgogerychwyrndrobwllllantysiliogogogochensis]
MVVVDRTAPRVVSRAPEPGAQDVWVKSPIQAVFSEPVNASTVTSASVRLTVGGVEVARTVSLSGDGKTMTVVPGAGYAPSHPVQLILTEQLVDLAGNSLNIESRGWDWTIPFWIPWGTGDGALLSARDSDIKSHAFDAAGNLVATWSLYASNLHWLYVKRYESGEWKTYGQNHIAFSNQGSLHDNSLILDSAGNPIVAWTQPGSSGSSTVQVKRWTGTQWESLGEHVEVDASMPQKAHPHLEWAPSGQPAIAWSESEFTVANTVCAAEWATNNWSPLGNCFNARDTSNYVTNPVLKYTRSKVPTIAWVATGATENTIHVSQFLNNTWTVLDAEDHNIQVQEPYVSLAFGPTDQPILTWLAGTGSGNDCVATKNWFDSYWALLGTPQLPTAGTLTTMGPALETDSTGTPFVAWTSLVTLTPTDSRLRTSRWTGLSWESLDDASFTVEGRVLTNQHTLQRTSTGEMVLSWRHLILSEDRMRVRRLNR